MLPCRQICCLDEDLGVERLLYRAQNRFVFCDCRNEVVIFTMHKGYQPVESLLELLRRATRSDPRRTAIHGMTSLGLVEISRQKKSLPLSASIRLEARACEELSEDRGENSD